MLQGILHLMGDYLLQNDWMAENKGKFTAKGYLACLVHCLFYTIPFALAYESWHVVWIVFSTRFLIDKYKLAIFWCRIKNWHWKGSNFGYDDEKPKWMTV